MRKSEVRESIQEGKRDRDPCIRNREEKKEQPRGRKEEPPPRLVAAPAVHSADEITKTLAMVASVRSR